MAITFTSTGGLFTMLGKIAKLLYKQNGTTAPNIDTVVGEINTALSGQPTLLGNLPSMQVAAKQASYTSVSPTLQQLAIDLVNKVVSDDVALQDKTDLTVTLQQIIAQMTSQGVSVKTNTVAASAAAVSGNNGNPKVVLSVIRPDGTAKELCFAETARLVCTSDSQTGGATEGTESWQYIGDAAEPNTFSETWPAGSGASASVTSVDSLITGGNLLANSSFETAPTSTTFTGWTVDTGTVNSNTAAFYRLGGAKSITFTGDSSTLTSMYQPFAAASTSSGTTNALKPLTAYALVIRHKFDVVPAAGVLRVDLVDGTNTVTTDAATTNNRLSITLSGLTTSWTESTVVFRTPRLLPSTGLRLRVYLSTAISTGSILFIDDIALTEMQQVYEGGPLIAVFAGSSKTLVNDEFTVTVTNNRGGASYAADFQTMFDRLFDMKSKKLQLPSASSPTAANTLITA